MATIKRIEAIQSWQKARAVWGRLGQLINDELKSWIVGTSGQIQKLIKYLVNSDVEGMRNKLAAKQP